MKSLCILLVVFLLGLVQCDTISLPDYSGPELSMYSGYIEINPSTGKSYFYWLVECINGNDAPLIVWYQGGPGCSGLLGLFTESGPLRATANEDVVYNNVAWTNFANVLYIEQPTGVGFSYSDQKRDYIINDTEAANDNFVFLNLWLKSFPNYIGRETWLSGESYGGVYIPTLVDVILQNQASLIATQLKGVTLGNPVISCASVGNNYNSIQMDIYYYRSLVSYRIYGLWIEYGCRTDSRLDECVELFQTAVTAMGVFDQQKRDDDQNEPSWDSDCLYQDFCIGNGTLDFAVNQGYPTECFPTGNLTTNYLNREDVQQAIGAKHAIWAECSNNLTYFSSGASMIPSYLNMFAAELQVLVYSGDVDFGTVPFGITQVCLGEIPGQPINSWQPWFVNGATAGYVEQYQNYTYATLKGAGHEAPQYQPLTSYEMISRFIFQESLLTEKAPVSLSPKRYNQAKALRKHGILKY